MNAIGPKINPRKNQTNGEPPLFSANTAHATEKIIELIPIS